MLSERERERDGENEWEGVEEDERIWRGQTRKGQEKGKKDDRWHYKNSQIGQLEWTVAKASKKLWYYQCTIYIPWEWHSSLNLPYCKGTNNKKGTEIVRDRKIKRGGNEDRTTLNSVYYTRHKSHPRCIMTPRIEHAVWWISDPALMCGVLAAKTMRWASVSLSLCLWGLELSPAISISSLTGPRFLCRKLEQAPRISQGVSEVKSLVPKLIWHPSNVI